jgi:DNA modification methylase
MALIDQKITEHFALYNGDACELLPTLPDGSIHLSVYSPPFAINNDTGGGGALYHYSSSNRDLSNCRTYAEFFQHYEFIVREIYRLTLPGRIFLETSSDCMRSAVSRWLRRASRFGKSRWRFAIER